MITLRAPAKINLSLRVLGRRADGYHDIESLIQMVGLYDEVVVSVRPRGIALRVVGADLPQGPGNLVHDAARRLAAEARVTRGASIRLTKRIPMGAGLGGGSSDAAATLIALNRLWRLQWSRRRLADLSASLGSDIPFFFFGPTAWVTGRGEQVTPQPGGGAANHGWAVLVNPGFAVSTRWAFETWRAPRRNADQPAKTEGPTRVANRLTKLNSTDTIPRLPGPPDCMARPAENTLESVTAAAYPVIHEIKRWLQDSGAGLTLMSGSGATVYGLFPNRAAAVCAHGRLPRAWQGWVVKLLRRVPW
jgi:4-diphosphocytidyl-2-C-methyl-D-erythritol kinase